MLAVPSVSSFRPRFSIGGAALLRDDRTAGSLSLFATVLVWASYYPIVEVLVRSWDALSLSLARLGIAAVVLGGLLYRREGRGAFVGIPWLRLFFLGCFGFAGFMVLTPIGIALSSGASSAMVTAANPALAALLAWGVWRETVNSDTWVAVAVSLVGGALVVLGGGSGIGVPGVGELLVLLANLCWLWASTMSQRWFPGSSQLRVSALTCFAGMVGMSVAALVLASVGTFEFRMGGTPESWGLMAVSAVGSCGAGLLFWNFGVSRLGLSTASVYANMVPVVAVAFALCMGERLSSLQLAGGAVIVVGVLWAQVGRQGWSRLVRRVSSGRPPVASLPPRPPVPSRGVSSCSGSSSTAG